MANFACTPLTEEDIVVGSFIEVVDNERHTGMRGKVIDVQTWPKATFVSFTDVDDPFDGVVHQMSTASMGLVRPDPYALCSWTTYGINQGPEDATFGPTWGPRLKNPRLLKVVTGH